jgi:hypothetical protein
MADKSIFSLPLDDLSAFTDKVKETKAIARSRGPAKPSSGVAQPEGSGTTSACLPNVRSFF